VSSLSMVVGAGTGAVEAGLTVGTPSVARAADAAVAVGGIAELVVPAGGATVG